MSKIPLISVILPVFNRPEYLSEAIESILNQSFPDFELIIIDDGSLIETKLILNYYSTKDSRVTIITNSSNMGITYSRNLGLENAKGKYIAVMDSDDVSLPERFKKQVEFLDQHPEIDVLGSQIINIGEGDSAGKVSNFPLTPGSIRWSFISFCHHAHPSVMMRSKLFTDEGYRYEEFMVAQDYDLWTRLVLGHKIANLPDILVKYRVHPGSLSIINDHIRISETSRIINTYVKELSGIDLPENIIKGLMLTKDIRSINEALLISKFLVQLEKKTRTWGLNRLERAEISHSTAFKLFSIYKTFRKNIRSIPILMGAGVLESKAFWFGKL